MLQIPKKAAFNDRIYCTMQQNAETDKILYLGIDKATRYGIIIRRTKEKHYIQK